MTYSGWFHHLGAEADNARMECALRDAQRSRAFIDRCIMDELPVLDASEHDE